MKTYRNILLSILFISGCISDKYDAPGADCVQEEIKANTTFSELKKQYTDGVMRITEPLVVEGYVISDDKAGNFYGSLYLQDSPDSPEQGLRVDLDIRDAYLNYPVGQKVVVNLQGMYLGKSRESYAVGGVYANAGGNLSVGRLPASQVKFHLFATCDPPVKIAATKIKLTHLDDSLIGTLVQLDGLEIAVKELCSTYAIAGESATERVLQDCERNEIVLRNSGYADFQEVVLPKGNGTVVGVLEKYSGKYQLVVRDTSDVKLTDERCDSVVLEDCKEGKGVSLDFVRQLYEGEKTLVPEGIQVSATVISDRNSGTTPETVAIIQDETGGMRCVFEEAHALNRNDSITIDLSGAVLEVDEGGMSVGRLTKERIISAEEGASIKPTEISISGELAAHESTLVRIDHLQFDHVERTFLGESLLTDCANYIGLYTSEEASFSEMAVPSGKGSITAMMSFKDGQPFLLLRDITEIDFKGEREQCDRRAELMITEYIEGSSYNKYIEIYNPGSRSVDLKWYALGRDNNGDGVFGERYVLPLEGEIGAGETKVYAHTRALIYSGEIAGTSGTPMSFNGNDQVVLLKNDRLIDRVGIGGDHIWGADKTFRRKTRITSPNSNYNEVEWDIIVYPKDDVSGLGKR
ncbi:DUF5689 domain-containing protein [Sinomicrobium sp.]